MGIRAAAGRAEGDPADLGDPAAGLDRPSARYLIPTGRCVRAGQAASSVRFDYVDWLAWASIADPVWVSTFWRLISAAFERMPVSRMRENDAAAFTTAPERPRG